MQLKYHKNLMPAIDGMQKVSACTWSPNGKRLAICTADRVIHLFDENFERKDKFPTKASDKGQKSYVVRALEFSPDSTKIAIAQSDNIVFMYKIGVDWGTKKSICNKYPTSSSVTCMTWPKDRHNDLVFGLAEGKIKIGKLSNNKSAVIYSTDSYAVSLASSRDGEAIISGHLDGTIYLFHMDNQQYQKLITHHSIPYALGWGEHIIAGGNDLKITFYDHSGSFVQRFDYTNDDKAREYSLASFNPSGDTVVVGSFNRFYVYNYSSKRNQWEEIAVKNIENYYTVTALGWKQDGSKLVTGSLCGSVDVYDASLKKIKYKGKFEFNYVAPNQIVVKTIATGNRVVVKSNYSNEIRKINVFQDRYVVANTYETLLLGDLETNKISELQWKESENEKFDFSNPSICMVFNSGELTLVEYGNNEPLGNCRTEHMKRSLISCRISYSPVEKGKAKKTIAFLLDLQTISIQDLETNSTIAHIMHDSKIDYLELNAHGNKLLFRDKRRQLYLYNIKKQSKNTLLSYCNYVQWVPDSEVVVAQNRNNLCVWYSIENPDKVTIYSIKGDVEDIERHEGKTTVLVNDGANTAAYTLDEPLIEFGFAIESRDLEKAANILDPLDMNPETEANWRTLAKISLEEQNIHVAEHCYAALGDISKAAFLRKMNKLIKAYETQTGNKDGINFYKVQAQLAMLDKQFHRAEAILLDHNEIEEAMEMYQELHKWDESIKIAEKKNHPDVKELKENYYNWLIQSNQDGKAAEIKENEGDFVTAINLYLKGGLPAKAANVVFNYNMSYPQDLLEKIANQLSQSGMFEKAGEFYEQMEMLQRALDCYCKGNAFNKAVELAKKAEPRFVVTLEEKWGDWLCAQKQTENAINHYIEANAVQKAIEAAIQSRQWSKAVQLISGQPAEISRPFFKQIAKHYAEIRQTDLAEKYFVKAGLPLDAFEMYVKANKWDLALKVAKENLSENDIVNLYVKQGQKLEEQGIYKDAERLYLTVDEPDIAINMYKKAQQYDHMIRLVAKFRPDLLKDTHLNIAQKLEHEGNFKNAEFHYVQSGAWRGAVEMYKSHNLWEQAIAVCKSNGTDKETCELAKKWAETLGAENGMSMLLKMNLVDAVIEYLMDRNEFDEAFKMANGNAKHKIADVHLKYALYLEDERRYKEAEEHFIKAGKPSEAINMYEHQADFHSALQVARQYEPQSVAPILMNQGKSLLERGDYAKAENCFITAKKPEIAIKMYTDLGNTPEALRVAKKHAPQYVNEIVNNFEKKGGVNMSGEEILSSAKVWEDQRDYQRAINTYLEIKKEHFSNHDILEEAWERAVQLALNYDKERVQDVIRIVSKRLKEIQRFEPAGELLENIGLYEEAVGTYVQGKLFEKAKACAMQVKNQQLNAKLMEVINKTYTVHLKNSRNAEDLVSTGEVNAGLDMLVERGDWKQCLDMAEKQGAEVKNRYLMRFAKYTMESAKFGECIAAFARYGIAALPANYTVYKTLILEIFVECEVKEVLNLRTTLFNFCKGLAATPEANSAAAKEFNKYLLIAHLYNMKAIYEKKNVDALQAKLSVSLLRYCDLIRMDKLYYEAGMAAKKMNWLSMAFIFLNRYLDIYEVIVDADANNLGDNSDFAITDIPSPFDVPLPEKNFITDKEKETIRDWLLQISINQKVEQVLPTRNCDQCMTKIFEASLKCFKCKAQWEPCMLSGYPLLKGNTVLCKSCGKGATKENWNVHLQNFANCPWCNNIPN